jgi:excisionase family DNA binding protein
MPRRFLTLDEVADELATSRAQVYALVRSGTLEAIKIGGRGQWRIERERLEAYIAQCYADTRALIQDGRLVDDPDD